MNKFTFFEEKPRVLVIGDLILDQYFFGKVDRISPEAPVPIVNVINNKFSLGGAGNVVNNLFEIGCDTSFIALVGKDDNAKIINELLKEKASFLKLIECENPTITKVRVIGNNQQLLRLDFEKIGINSLSIEEKILNTINQKIDDVDLVIISDYGKGIISESVSQAIINKALSNNIPVIVDPKGDDWIKYKKATIVTPNFKEFCEVDNKLLDKNDDLNIQKSGQLLIEKFGLSKILLTRSELGMKLIEKEKSINFDTVAKEVYDVSGAGDTVVATLGAFLAAKYDIVEAIEIANYAAGVVVGRIGTSPILGKDIQHYFLKK